MATEGNRPAVNGAPKPGGSPWFGVTGIVMLATLLAAIFVQTNQYLLLDQTVQRQDDYLALNLYQTELEYLRLREQWGLSAAEPAQARDALQLRYEIFVSRVGLLRTERASRLFAKQDAYDAALRSLGEFIDRADLYLGQNPRGQFSAPSLQALYAELKALDEPIHQLLLGAAHRVAEQVTERNRSIGSHNRVSLALTASLLALVLAFGWIAMRRLRQVQDAQRKAEALAARLHEARAQALRASQSKSEFLANMSHEIRTPFHGLLGMLSLLQETQLDVRQHDYLRSATESASHLLALLNDILDLSKLESGTLALLPQVIDPFVLVRAIEHSVRTPASAKGLALRVDIDAQVPRQVVLDGTRVRQILLSLMANAIKFTDAGSVALRGRCDAAQGLLEFEVTDTGVGMDAAALQGLFERFGQIDASRARRQQGSGLGLEIARKLARLMGGDIDARSTPRQGSVFTLRLPLKLPAAAAQAPGSAAAQPATPRRALKVLVAEDHPVNRQYLASLLELLGHQAHFVENGWAAVQAAKAQPFDIVLMDVHMPVMDGIVATETIRAFEGHDPQVPIIALTADALADTRERCLSAGMQEVLTKPLGMPELKALLIRHFGSAAGLAGEADPAAGAMQTAPLVDRGVLARLLDLLPRSETAALYGNLFVQAREASARMHRALRGADAGELQHASQGIKGAALNLGLRALADAADLINQQAAALNATQLALALQRFDETLAATRDLCVSESLVDRA